MRITKKILEERLERSVTFQKCELMVVRIEDVRILQDKPGFIDSCCYTPWQIPYENEVGRLKNIRFVTDELPIWERS